MKVSELLAETARGFRSAKVHFGHGTGNARDEAAWLIAHVLGIHPGELHAHRERALNSRQALRVQGLAARRVRERIPLAYLLHEAWLDGLRFYVDRRVIVPRSFISEVLREGLAPWLSRPPRRALDLCTGSGCLAVLTARAFPRTRVDASDLSAATLQVARRNVRDHGVAARVRLVRSDLFDALGAARYDLIVTNPPYVDARTMKSLPPEYDYEPRNALAAGADGLDLVRRILRDAPAHLAPRGLLVCEVGDARRALERAYPRLPFAWAETSDPESCVFVIEREQLSGEENVG